MTVSAFTVGPALSISAFLRDLCTTMRQKHARRWPAILVVVLVAAAAAAGLPAPVAGSCVHPDPAAVPLDFVAEAVEALPLGAAKAASALGNVEFLALSTPHSVYTAGTPPALGSTALLSFASDLAQAGTVVDGNWTWSLCRTPLLDGNGNGNGTAARVAVSLRLAADYTAVTPSLAGTPGP